MVSAQSAPKRFRIERLEERTSPGILFWMDDLSEIMFAQWAIIEGSDTRQRTQFTAAQSATSEPSPVREISQPGTSNRESVEFPGWADVLLQEVDRDLDSNSKAAPDQSSRADRFTGFSEIMKRVSQAEAKSDRLPAWVQELLGDLDQRPEKEAVAQSASEHDSGQAANLDKKIGTDAQPESGVDHLPVWAKELLSEVDRRLVQESGSDTAGGIDTHQSTRLEELLSRVSPAARKTEANVG